MNNNDIKIYHDAKIRLYRCLLASPIDLLTEEEVDLMFRLSKDASIQKQLEKDIEDE
jgi:hypothetical protein